MPGSRMGGVPSESGRIMARSCANVGAARSRSGSSARADQRAAPPARSTRARPAASPESAPPARCATNAGCVRIRRKIEQTRAHYAAVAQSGEACRSMRAQACAEGEPSASDSMCRTDAVRSSWRVSAPLGRSEPAALRIGSEDAREGAKSSSIRVPRHQAKPLLEAMQAARDAGACSEAMRQRERGAWNRGVAVRRDQRVAGRDHRRSSRIRISPRARGSDRTMTSRESMRAHRARDSPRTAPASSQCCARARRGVAKDGARARQSAAPWQRPSCQDR